MVQPAVDRDGVAPHSNASFQAMPECAASLWAWGGSCNARTTFHCYSRGDDPGLPD